MQRLRIGFDVDGVLANFEKYYLDRVRELWPDFVRRPEWDFGLTKEQQNILWAEIKATHNFWRSLQPIEPNVELPDANHTLIFVTSRVPTAGGSTEHQTAAWLEDWLQVYFPTVIVVEHWHEKPALYKHLHLDSYIDDKPETVDRMSQLQQNVYVYNQDWNANCSKVVPRVGSIKEYIERVEAQFGPK